MWEISYSHITVQIYWGKTMCTAAHIPKYTESHAQHLLQLWCYMFWGQSPSSSKVFLLQKRVIRTMMCCGGRDTCRGLFSELGIVTLSSQYIFCLLQFVVKNGKLFSLNMDMHSINTRQLLNLHQPSAHLKKCQLGTYNMGIKMFNTLPPTLKK